MQTSASLQPHSESSASPNRRWWRVVALLWLVIATGHFNRTSIQVAGSEQIIRHGVLTETQMGLVYTAFLLLYTLAMVPTGWLIDRIGARAALIALCFGSAFFVAATAVVGGLFQTGWLLHTELSLWIGLLVVRSIMGTINAPLHPGAARMVFDQVPHRSKSLANGFVTSAACVGVAATYYGFGKLIDWFGWPGAFLTTSLVTLGIAVVWTKGTRAIGQESRKAPAIEAVPRTEILHVLKNRGVICLTLSYAALGYLQYLFFYWTPYYLSTVEGLGDDVSRKLSTIIQVSMGVGMVLGGWLADRMPLDALARSQSGRVPMFGMAASGVVFVLGLTTSNQNVLSAMFAASAGLIGMCEGAFWTTAVELGGTRGGLAGGIMNMGGNLGGMLSPVVCPFLSQIFTARFSLTTGWRLSLAVGGVVAFLGASLWLGIAQTPIVTEDVERNP